MTIATNGVTCAAMLALLLCGAACGSDDDETAASGAGGSGGTDSHGGDGGADTGGDGGGAGASGGGVGGAANGDGVGGDTGGGGAGADTGGGSGEPLGVDERADSAEQLVIGLTGSLQNPAWGPDSDALVFTRFVDGYNSETADLFIVDVPDGEPRVLVQEGSANVNLPGSSWSEATASIVFSSSRDPHDEIFVIDDGGTTGDEEQVTQRDDYAAYEPTLSPDGAWVAFESHPVDVEDNGIIMKYALDGSSDYVALTGADDDCRQPNWSPAGDLILYQRFDGNEWNLWVVDQDGTGARQVTTGPGDKTDASFSPDGQWIVYSSDAGELEFANLYVMPIAGGAPVRVTVSGGYDGAPSWSPDGTRIAFESYPGDPDDSEGTTLWIIDLPPL